ncbi:hypothetical protein FS749_008500 [Ceratobasidium sp. UAMH 11750]|nr:hypothetical protein FS749_008500 [Ceratobasidium sp. UAMH 11750]
MPPFMLDTCNVPMASSDPFLSTSDGPSNSTLQEEGLPTRIRCRGANNVSMRAEPVPEPTPEWKEDVEMQSEGGLDYPGDQPALESTDVHDLSRVPVLNEEDIWVRRHPASGYASSLRLPSKDPETPILPKSTDTNPIWPFQTRQDLKQTEVFIQHRATNPHMNDQLALEREKSQDPSNPLTLRTADDVHAVLELAVPADSQFEVIDFPTHFRGYNYTHRLRMQSLHAIFSRMLLNPDVKDCLVYYPEQLYVRNPSNGKPMRVWEESYHGDDWWNIQNTLGLNTRVLYVQLYMDATTVSIFGGVKVWPVYAWLGNIPSALRKKHGPGGAVLVAYIPVVHKDKRLSSSDRAELRSKVYQQAIAYILEMIKMLLQHGEYLRCADGQIYFFVAVIAVISADYEELAKIVTILGSLSRFPCPICLVPRELQAVLTGQWLARTRKGTLAILQRARKAKTAAFRKLIRQEQSLRKTQNSFLKLMGQGFSVFQAIAADPLHQLELGVFGSHMWPWLLKYILHDDHKARLDERFKSIQRYPDLKHFPNGVTSIENLQGKEKAIILRMLPPLIEDLLPAKRSKLLLQALRALGCIHLLSKLTTHSEATLDLLSAQIARFGELSQQIHDVCNNFSIAYPKMHSLSHLVDIIKRKGPTDNYHTGLGEGLHPQSKLAYKKTNKQPGFEKQMLRIYLEQQAMTAIRSRIERADATSNQPVADAEQPTASGSDHGNSHFDFGSRCRRLLTSDFIDRQTTLHPNHLHFERDLKTFLYQNVAGLGQRREFKQRDLPSLEGTKVTHYQLIRLSYISMENSCEKVEMVRANLDWRGGGPRYDCVMIQGHADEGIWFARLLSLFTLEFRGQSLEIAYIQRFRTLPSRNRSTGYIELEDQGVYNFVYAGTLIRPCLILSPGIRYKRHVVGDLLDADVYLRLLTMK